MAYRNRTEVWAALFNVLGVLGGILLGFAAYYKPHQDTLMGLDITLFVFIAIVAMLASVTMNAVQAAKAGKPWKLLVWIVVACLLAFAAVAINL